MTTTHVRRGAAAAVAGVFLMGGLAACGGAAVEKSDVEKTIKQKLTESGVKVESVKCEDNLKAEVKATTDCDAKVGGTTQKLRAVVKSVDGKTVNYTVEKR
ncbi:DUF4333 domain-containing protein [Yimella sp. cx-573]|nr:DUF4333 domain-containing protein [Yimella sp. cx-573]